MGGNCAQHVGGGCGSQKLFAQSISFYRQPSPLWSIHDQSYNRMAKQLRQRFDGLQPEQTSVDRARCLRPCPSMPRRYNQGGLGEAKQ